MTTLATTLAPFVLWSAASAVYGGWLLRRDVRGPAPAASRRLSAAGWALAAVGVALSLACAPWGAALGAATAHFTGAVSAMAVLAPLARRPHVVLAQLVALGGMLGLAEGLS